MNKTGTAPETERIRAFLINLSILVFMILWSFWIYRYGIYAFPRQDHFSFMFDRSLFQNDWDYFWHVISFSKTRTTFPGDYYLFRPATHGILALIDIFFRSDLYTAGRISIFWHGITAFVLYLFTSKFSGRMIGFILAFVFATQYPGLEMVIWRHVSPYMLGLCFFTCGLLMIPKITESHRLTAIAALLFLISGFFFENIIVVMAIAFLIFLILGTRTQENALRNFSFQIIKIAALVILVYSALYIFEYLMRPPPSFLGPADRNAATFTWLDTVYGLCTISGLLFTAFLFPHKVDLFYDSEWYRAWWEFFETGSNFFYGWLGVFLGILLTITFVKGAFFLFRKQQKAIAAIFVFVFLYFGAVAGGLSLGRASLRSVSYMTNATYYYYMTGFLLTMIAALLIFISKKSEIVKHFSNGVKQILWFLLILFSTHQVTLSYERIQTVLGSRYGFDKGVAEATSEVAKRIRQNELFCYGGAIDPFLGNYLLNELLYRESCMDKQGVPLYAVTGPNQIFWLIKFKESDVGPVSLQPVELLENGQKVMLSTRDYNAESLDVTMYPPFNGGLVVAYKNPGNFLLLLVKENTFYAHQMRGGRLSPPFVTHELKPAPQYDISIKRVGTDYAVFYNENVITRLEAGSGWIGKIGLIDYGSDSGRQAFSELKVSATPLLGRGSDNIVPVFRLRFPTLQNFLKQEQGWAVASSSRADY